MALRATGRLLRKKLFMGVSKNFSAEEVSPEKLSMGISKNFIAKEASSENVQKTLLNELHKKRKLEEIRCLTAAAERDIAYWEPLFVKGKARYLNGVTCMALTAIYIAGDYIYCKKTCAEGMLRGR
ncbi:uncharacterized protein LOC113306294 [Papaver somniferum]|uniref:uncharacterized protein LOC113306294 n=1 Tax=Papaver somniferum TaxID=3469 RepID=UPI000E6FD4E6|nr:uncharacterized protein LOC113306294 [Papaver somniferum]